MSVYEQKTPIKWAAPPSKYSYSSLKKIGACPRQWQLLNSDWGQGQLFPVRMHPAGIEGKIVHDALDMLNRSLSRGGRPPIGSPMFQEIIDNCGFWAFFEKQTIAWNIKLSEHPKAGPYYVLRTPPRDLANVTIRLFRQRYRPASGQHQNLEVFRYDGNTDGCSRSPLELLQRYGALSEMRLDHPLLPFFGYLDLVTIDKNGAVNITDFKSGEFHSGHHDQLLAYGALWWRCTGTAQIYVELQYLNNSKRIKLNDQDFQRAEAEIADKIGSANAALSSFPAPVIPGTHCGMCAVRARCDEGWKALQNLNPKAEISVDLEVLVKDPPTQNGFLGQKIDGSDVNIVYQAPLAGNFVDFSRGKKLRIVGAMLIDDGSQVEVKPWTEVFKI